MMMTQNFLMKLGRLTNLLTEIYYCYQLRRRGKIEMELIFLLIYLKSIIDMLAGIVVGFVIGIIINIINVNKKKGED